MSTKEEQFSLEDLESIVILTITEDGEISVVTTKKPTQDQIKILGKILLVINQPSIFLTSMLVLESFVNWLDFITKKAFFSMIKFFKKK